MAEALTTKPIRRKTGWPLHAWRLRDDEVREASVTVRRADVRVVARWFRFGDSPDGPRRYPGVPPRSTRDGSGSGELQGRRTADTPQRWFCGCVPHDAPGVLGRWTCAGSRALPRSRRGGAAAAGRLARRGNRLMLRGPAAGRESRRRERGRSTLRTDDGCHMRAVGARAWYLPPPWEAEPPTSVVSDAPGEVSGSLRDRCGVPAWPS